MKWKPFSREEVSIQIKAEPELIPVEGNASASGDDAFDREVEHNILCRIQQGDVWAWAMVTVTVSSGLRPGARIRGPWRGLGRT